MDGKILYFGKLDDSFNMEQVKGVHYSLVSFCGPKHPLVREIIKSKENLKKERNSSNSQVKYDSLTHDTESTTFVNEHNQEEPRSQKFEICKSKLYYCILYLAPGDYHWFHSPTEWTIEHRRHVPGKFGHLLECRCKLL